MKKILVVEDVDINRDLIMQILEEEYEVFGAANGREGIELAQKENPDLIIMDLSLPEVDGWEATKRLKADEATKHIPIIALSAHAMSSDEDKAKMVGCDDYLSKPLSEDLLMSKIKIYLKEEK
ncbi:MAG: response regulator [Elusimicrobiota bacterium]